jgi:hypothetical protein
MAVPMVGATVEQKDGKMVELTAVWLVVVLVELKELR